MKAIKRYKKRIKKYCRNLSDKSLYGFNEKNYMDLHIMDGIEFETALKVLCKCLEALNNKANNGKMIATKFPRVGYTLSVNQICTVYNGSIYTIKLSNGHIQRGLPQNRFDGYDYKFCY